MQFLILLCLSAAEGTLVSPHERDVLEQARKHYDSYPQWLRDEFTVANLKKFHTVTTIEVSDGQNMLYTFKPSSNQTQSGQINPADIAQIGKVIWDIVADNTPVVNYTADWAGAVPKGITDWTQLSSWKEFVSKEYQFLFKNALGMKLTSFQWVFKFNYNGQFNGTGSYVQGLGASINKVYAYLTEHVDVSCKAFNPTNYGSSADPIAGVDYQVTMISHGYFEKTEVGCHIIAKGNGDMVVVTCNQN